MLFVYISLSMVTVRAEAPNFRYGESLLFSAPKGKLFWYDLQESSISSSSSPAVKKTYSYVDLFSNKHVALVTSSQALLWLTASMLYFTLGLESSKLGGNMYEVFALSILFEVPGCFASLFLCNRFGRKKTVLGSFVLCGVFTGAIAAIPR